MQGNMDRNNSEYGLFSRSDYTIFPYKYFRYLASSYLKQCFRNLMKRLSNFKLYI